MILIPKKQLLTMDVFYYYPDRPLLIQEFIWSYEDYLPKLNRTRKFLKHWEETIEAQIQEIVIFGLDNERPNRFRSVAQVFEL